MIFKIKEGKSFGEVQDEFNKIFPFLKINFTSVATLSKKLHPKFKQSEFDSVDTFIAINDNTTVAELVTHFKEVFDLPVKVLRKSNNLWIETSLTDSWTLGMQNMAGKQFNAS